MHADLRVEWDGTVWLKPAVYAEYGPPSVSSYGSAKASLCGLLVTALAVELSRKTDAESSIRHLRLLH